MGLDHSDRRVLETLIEKYNGGPVGLSTLAASLNEDAGTLKKWLNPTLIGYETYFQGRVATERAYKHLGIQQPTVK